MSVPSISDSKYEVSPTGQLLKVQITDEVREGIQEFKKRLPQIIGTRSVTVGVCIREILKAASQNVSRQSHNADEFLEKM